MNAKELMKLASEEDNLLMSNTKEKMMDTDKGSSEEKKEETKSEEKKEEKKDEEKTAGSCGKDAGFKKFQKFKGGRQ